MLSTHRNILIFKTRPQFSKQPAKPFRNYSLGGISRPNMIYVSKFTTYPNIRDVEKIMSESTNATSDRVIRSEYEKKSKKEKATPRNSPPKILSILRGGGKSLKRAGRKQESEGGLEKTKKRRKLKAEKKTEIEGQKGGKKLIDIDNEMGQKKKTKDTNDVEEENKIFEEEKTTKKEALDERKRQEKEEEEENEEDEGDDEEAENEEEEEEEEEENTDDSNNDTDTENYSTDSDSEDNTRQEKNLADALMHPLKVLKSQSLAHIFSLVFP